MAWLGVARGVVGSVAVLLACAATASSGCADPDADKSESGGASGAGGSTGGTTSSGGAQSGGGTGGNTPTGGTSTGGTAATGGAISSGGTSGSGGTAGASAQSCHGDLACSGSSSCGLDCTGHTGNVSGIQGPGINCSCANGSYSCRVVWEGTGGSSPAPCPANPQGTSCANPCALCQISEAANSGNCFCSADRVWICS
jgi:hypothetical protein